MIKNITHVRGIKAWGAHIGIKSNRRDLAIIFSEKPASAAAVFTQNLVVSEPIKACRGHLDDGILQAFVVNSGNANACTGDQGMAGAQAMIDAAARTLAIPREHVLISSTGIIGEPFPTEKVVKGIEKTAPLLSDRPQAGSMAANAILTTDTFAKEGFVSYEMDGQTIHIAGIAKGSGMIHPNMATMLGYIVSDVAIDPSLLRKALRACVDKTFNMITVDGDTSTNDTVAIMCNGMAGTPEIKKEDAAYEKFYHHLEKLCAHLAKLIVSDGEGATKFIEYHVRNAPSDEAARKIVRTISDSSLVKTAMFGEDPNWGRIIAAAGRAGVLFDPDKVDLYFGTDQPLQILKNSQPVSHDRMVLQKKMRSSHITVILDLNAGEGQAVGWGSDLSYDYVRINAEYTT
ncbi:MAG: bifunctional glutamate N-acetyltransferase/amino-acid acetyltransferase ArgJ [Calditrichaeota bacterium]|nr:MAG: bifunctional glutamate N-acetyltransferase/amino-acid acetyltransferase ArgJ [Calditrichota bacterium]